MYIDYSGELHFLLRWRQTIVCQSVSLTFGIKKIARSSWYNLPFGISCRYELTLLLNIFGTGATPWSHRQNGAWTSTSKPVTRRTTHSWSDVAASLLTTDMQRAASVCTTLRGRLSSSFKDFRTWGKLRLLTLVGGINERVLLTSCMYVRVLAHI